MTLHGRTQTVEGRTQQLAVEKWKVVRKSCLVSHTDNLSGGTPSNAAKRAASACNLASLAAKTSSYASRCIGYAGISSDTINIWRTFEVTIANACFNSTSLAAKASSCASWCVSPFVRKSALKICAHNSIQCSPAHLCRQCLLQLFIFGRQCFLVRARLYVAPYK